MTAVLDLRTALPQQAGLARLADEVRATRTPPPRTPSDALCSLFDAELRVGLEAGDTTRAVEAALALWRRSGDLLRSHAAVAKVLAAVGAACADGQLPAAQANRVAATAARLVAVLRAQTPAGTGGRVVLVTPLGDHHALALESLAHLLDEAGFAADVCGALAPHELAAASGGACGVVVSVHLTTTALPALVAAARRAAPGAVVAVGGPGGRSVPGADLVGRDPAALLDALRRGGCPLSEREREVLGCVAQGMTNAEAAAVLGIAPGTLKAHLDHVFDKTGTGGRAAEVALGLREGWLR